MGRSGYTSLSIEEKTYARIRREWDRQFGSDYDLTYTQWHTNVVLSALERTRFLKKAYPNLAVVKVISHGIIIDDSKNPEKIIKVISKGNKIICSEKDMAEQYIQFALLHPEFDP